MSLAIFDLDNTLLAGDSDYLWGQYLVDGGWVDREEYQQANARYYEQYRNGTLDILEFLAFALRPLSVIDPATLLALRDDFVETRIRPILLDKAHALLDTHRNGGDLLLIITATNRFVTEPIAQLYGVEHLLATEPEITDGRYTGRPAGVPCFQGGKVQRLRQWLATTGHSLAGSRFYSDSYNDLPLLSAVEHPIAVDPDAALATHALQSGWPVMSLRDA